MSYREAQHLLSIIQSRCYHIHTDSYQAQLSLEISNLRVHIISGLIAAYQIMSISLASRFVFLQDSKRINCEFVRQWSMISDSDKVVLVFGKLRPVILALVFFGAWFSSKRSGVHLLHQLIFFMDVIQTYYYH